MDDRNSKKSAKNPFDRAASESHAEFLREVADVRPIAKEPELPRRRTRRELPRRDANSDIRAHLDAIVTGAEPLDIDASAEVVQGIAEGVDRRLLRKLRRGEYAIEAHLDLHGKTRIEAQTNVSSFIEEARRKGHRCVLIIHGRGLHSEGGLPVLKENLVGWLMRGSIARSVLAFSSARPADGGLGAVYVLLRR